MKICRLFASMSGADAPSPKLTLSAVILPDLRV
jgi:hypothetical protein